MSIELLWIIPIVAAALFMLLLINLFQKEQNGDNKDSNDKNLYREVAEYNKGTTIDNSLKSITSAKRINEIEATIQLVSTALSNQQKIIEKFLGKDITIEKELDDLNKKLNELQHEYDITLSENYSLKARLKKLTLERENIADSLLQSPLRNKNFIDDSDNFKDQKVIDIGLYKGGHKEKSSKKLSDFDDTREIDISKLR